MNTTQSNINKQDNYREEESMDTTNNPFESRSDMEDFINEVLLPQSEFHGRITAGPMRVPGDYREDAPIMEWDVIILEPHQGDTFEMLHTIYTGLYLSVVLEQEGGYTISVESNDNDDHYGWSCGWEHDDIERFSEDLHSALEMLFTEIDGSASN